MNEEKPKPKWDGPLGEAKPESRAAAPGGREEAELRKSAQSEHEAMDVDADFSETDPALKRAIAEPTKPAARSLGTDGPAEGQTIEPNVQRLKNPFVELLDLDATGSRLTRKNNGSWSTEGGLSIADLEAARRKERAERRAEDAPAASSAFDKKIAETLANVPSAFRKFELEPKVDLTDHVSRRDEMRIWWMEKMKQTRSTDRAGAMLGVEVPYRDAVVDEEMMMRQYGKGHMPKTTEEWQIHNTWDHKKKYLQTVQAEPRYLKWSKRVAFSAFLYVYVGQCLYFYWGGYKQNQSYRYTSSTDLTHEHDKYVKSSSSINHRAKCPSTIRKVGKHIDVSTAEQRSPKLVGEIGSQNPHEAMFPKSKPETVTYPVSLECPFPRATRERT
ncbi:hypothetical protein DIPPA_10091 [Diplonema papillatum]|nr:hypothetical protein DIPPA_10091 [Diplonema papillatum]